MQAAGNHRGPPLVSVSAAPAGVEIRYAFEVSQSSREESAALVETDARKEIVGQSDSCTLTFKVDARFGCPRRRLLLDRLC